LADNQRTHATELENEHETRSEEHEELYETEDGPFDGDSSEHHFFEPENGQKTVENGRAATQFKPGNPGGPGRPRKPRSMKGVMRNWLFKDDELHDARKILDVLYDRAMDGNMTAIRLILEHSKPDPEPR
jgi:hypothetical protein